MKLSAKLPQNDKGAQLMRFEGIRGQRYTEIFLIGGHAITHQLVGGVYNTTGNERPRRDWRHLPAGRSRQGRPR
jgi:hypothetical protein